MGEGYKKRSFDTLIHAYWHCQNSCAKEKISHEKQWEYTREDLPSTNTNQDISTKRGSEQSQQNQF